MLPQHLHPPATHGGAKQQRGGELGTFPDVHLARGRSATFPIRKNPGRQPVIPLLRAGLIQSAGIIADSLSGVSGAGRKADPDYLFCECNESVRPYGVPKHRHLSEIEEQLALAAGAPVTIQFTPHLIPVNRGILTTLYLNPARPVTDAASAAKLAEQVAAAYHAAYDNEPFVRLLEGKALPDTKNVTGTNCIEIAWRTDPRTGRLIVMSAEDNIVKGASGQAVQSLNLVAGWPETTGLV